MRALLFVSLASVLYLFFMVQSAIVQANQISWVSSVDPALKVDESQSEEWGGNQTCSEQSVFVGNDTTPTTICVYYADNWRYGMYSKQSSSYGGNVNSLVIGFANDQKMYKVDGLPTTAAPLGVTNEGHLIYKTFTASNTFNLEIYKNVPTSLTRTVSGPTLATSYSLDNPDIFMPKRPNGIPVGIKAVSLSEDRQWLVAEARGIGLLRINLENFDMVRFSNFIANYGASNNPDVELAVSNDGEHVFVGGNMKFSATVFKVFSITDTCGDSSITDEMYHEIPVANPCPEKDLTHLLNQEWAPLEAPTKMHLSSDSGELNTYLYKGWGDYKGRWVTLTASGYTPPQQLDYLALGDSNSSGEGDTEKNPTNNKKYYRDWTDLEQNLAHNQPREKCHISTRSYPYRLATGMELGEPKSDSTTKWQSVACAGAHMYDINKQNSSNYEGQGEGSRYLWSSGGEPRLKDFSNKDDLKYQALNEFIPGRHKQIEFVKKYKPKVATLTMGGNDVDFGGKLGSCATNSISTCPTAQEQGRKDLGKQIKKQFTKLTSLYREIKDTSPGIKLYVLGYPQIIIDGDNVSCPTNTWGLNLEERKVVVAGYWYMNQVIKTATRKEGVQYVDVSQALNGHRLCEEGEAYAKGVIAGAFSSDERQESFHPNADGNAAIANAVWDAVDGQSLLEHDGYTDNRDDTITQDDISDSDYLQTALANGNNKEQKNMTDGVMIRSNNTDILLNPFSLEPNSTVNVTLHSDPVDLGVATASNEGSLDANITIPADAPVGYHTLALEGKTYSGEPIQYEQTILVKSSDPDDIDDNGIPDAQQVCGPFLEPVNVDADLDSIDDACDPEIGEPPADPNDSSQPEEPTSPVPEPPTQPTQPQPSPIQQFITIIINIITFMIGSIKRLFRW